ncbi:MAG TPA: choice-of-anchor B family protein [Candidatus Omnitrophota bacterium]|nr:choice-of-anchor B family protein [Candidatus Omnitrophota bacterium]
MPRLRHSVFFSGLALGILISGHQATFAQQSRNITLLTHLNLYNEYTNSWPYIHTDGREYVAVGTRDGTSIVRLTDPSNPVEVGFIPGIACGTRDVDQYLTYIYVVGRLCGTSSPGIQIISMADPDHPVLVNTAHGFVETSENISIDPVRAILFAAETNELTAPQDGYRILSLADPVNPVGISGSDAYNTHDFTFSGTQGYAAAITDGVMHILDLTAPAVPLELATFATPGGNPHTAWATSDGHYLIVSDENIVEPYGEFSIFDIRNLAQISRVNESNTMPGATVHYPRVRSNQLFLANYSAGVRVWDITDPTWPAESGYYDTWAGDDRILAGVYDVSPFYPSGIFTATDRSTGLYVFRADNNYGIVRGTVMDGRTPVFGALARALPEGVSTRTDANGRFALAPVPGSSTIEVSSFGYGTQSTPVTVSQGSSQTLGFALAKLGTATVKGRVARASDGSDVAGAEVTIRNTPLTTLTTGRGTYSLAKVPEGPLTVRAEQVGLVPAAIPITLVAKKTATVDFSLQTPLFYDDADTDRGWSFSVPDDDATEGRWIRAVPIGTLNGSTQAQPATDHTPDPGSQCFVTGNGPVGGPASNGDVDGGKTTLTSPVVALAGVSDPRIAFWRWFYSTHIILGPAASPFITQLSNDGGATWVEIDRIQARRTPWERFEIRVTDFFPTPGDVRVRFIARDDYPGGSVIEAAIDDFTCYSGAGTGLREPMAVADATRDILRLRSLGRSGQGASLELSLDRPMKARVHLFDVRGRLVRTLHDGTLPAGEHRMLWNGLDDQGRRAAAGVYLVRASAGATYADAKVILLR